TVRSLVLAGAAAVAILVFRVAAPAARHAVWTMAVAGMVWLAVLGPVMPPIALRVLRAPAPAALPARPAAPRGRPAALPTSRALAQPLPAVAEPGNRRAQAAAFIYLAASLFFLARLVFGYLFMVRLVRASRRLDGDWSDPVYESSWISVPMT